MSVFLHQMIPGSILLDSCACLRQWLIINSQHPWMLVNNRRSAPATGALPQCSTPAVSAPTAAATGTTLQLSSPDAPCQQLIKEFFSQSPGERPEHLRLVYRHMTVLVPGGETCAEVGDLGQTLRSIWIGSKADYELWRGKIPLYQMTSEDNKWRN